MASLTGLRASAGRKALVFGLVRVDVAMAPMYDSTADSRPTRNTVCPEHNVKLHQKWHCDEGDHMVDEPTKAVEYEGQFVITDESEWKALEADKSNELQLQAWVDELNPRSIENSYFIWPDNPASVKGYSLVAALLAKRGGCLIGVTEGDHGTAKVFAVRYDKEQRQIVAHVCRHENYLRVGHAKAIQKSQESFAQPTAEEEKMAELLLDSLPTTFNNGVSDTLGDAQWEYVKAKAKGEKPKSAEARAEVEVSDLQEALKASIAQVEAQKPPAKKRRAKTPA